MSDLETQLQTCSALLAEIKAETRAGRKLSLRRELDRQLGVAERLKKQQGHAQPHKHHKAAAPLPPPPPPPPSSSPSTAPSTPSPPRTRSRSSRSKRTAAAAAAATRASPKLARTPLRRRRVVKSPKRAVKSPLNRRFGSPRLVLKRDSSDARPSPAPKKKRRRGVVGEKKVQNLKLREQILSDMVDPSELKPEKHGFSSIVGLANVKQALNEMVILPMRRPDVFTGLRAPPNGLLLYGPPGNGKTMIARAVAAESRANFFSISASSLSSKWRGESEKLMRTLFQVAREHAPSIIFFDEIDALLSRRGGNSEHEASRRVKTEFLVQFDGASKMESGDNERRVVVIAATNIPEQLDEAAVRRFPKRLLVPLPGETTRSMYLEKMLRAHSHALSAADVRAVVSATDGFSFADLRSLCTEASMGPVRELETDKILTVRKEDLTPISLTHFKAALAFTQPSTIGHVERDDS